MFKEAFTKIGTGIDYMIPWSVQHWYIILGVVVIIYYFIFPHFRSDTFNGHS